MKNQMYILLAKTFYFLADITAPKFLAKYLKDPYSVTAEESEKVTKYLCEVKRYKWSLYCTFIRIGLYFDINGENG